MHRGGGGGHGVFHVEDARPAVQRLDTDLFGSAVCVVRWILFPINLGFAGYFMLQCFHACTFACVHTGIQRRIVASVQETQEASAQGTYFFYNGMFLGLMTLASGYLYAWLGLSSYYIMSGVAAFGLAMVVFARSLQPRSSSVGEERARLHKSCKVVSFRYQNAVPYLWRLRGIEIAYELGVLTISVARGFPSRRVCRKT